MDSTRPTPTAAATGAATAAARAVAQPNPESRVQARPVRPAPAPQQAPSYKPVGYGLPCSKCHLYYPANLTACPICRTAERVSPKIAAVKVSQPAPARDTGAKKGVSPPNRAGTTENP